MPPPVFLQKSPQTIENKGRGHEKERQESLRAGKSMKTKGLGRAGPKITRPSSLPSKIGASRVKTRPDRVGAGAGRRVDAEIGKALAKLVGGESCPALRKCSSG
jgi:hypothetical protein